MSDDVLQQAISLSKEGRKEEARRLLQETIRSNPRNELAWLWYADTLSTSAERIQALQWCLKFNPDSTVAQKGLEALGANKTEILAASPQPKAIPTARDSHVALRWEEKEYHWHEPTETYYCEDCGDPLVICGACGAFFCKMCQQTRCIVCNRPLTEGAEETLWARLGFGIVNFKKVFTGVEDEVAYEEVYEH